ncbi:hypothetical protein BJP40_07100 [Streptomyces sp. CC53]|uniref:protein kinase n=1 Tax=unclassified Streptomyces TaxID=2593676 RepID=UPI0008DCA340|nr:MULTISPECIES: protein kinase [unclassified Streptomyces]OII61059.1 hypothetical protein BJP40_07100 [Streptomyces sp. CC53]
MEDYAGRVLADRYRLPLPESDGDPYAAPHESGAETRAFDTYSGQEVMVRQVPLPETVDAEVVGPDGADGPYGYGTYGGDRARHGAVRTSARTAGDRAAAQDPAVQRALDAVQAVARIPDHPRLDQVFDVFTEDGSLWIVSELVEARPLAAFLGERPLNPYRAAEIASDLLTALRALHAHGWTHRNITVRTVLVCDDGRVVLSGLATGAAEEALCGYAPVPVPEEDEPGDGPAAVDGEACGAPYGEPYAGTYGAGHDRPYGDGYADAHGPHTGADHDTTYEHDGYGSDADRDGPYGGYGHGNRAEGARAVPADRGAPALPPGPPALPSGYEPQWVTQAADRIADDPDEPDGPEDNDAAQDGGSAPRALLTGTWRDGPVPAGGGSSPYGDVPPYGGPRAALRADEQRQGTPAPYAPAQRHPHGEPGRAAPRGLTPAGPPPYRGPGTPLAAERARQARIAVVGPVTERWAPEQAGPVHGTWQLAPPVGPTTDLWALGVLLFRVLQGHAPYPEDSAAELVQMVCAEPPAFAEECGPLRPVVESLLRQDPTERPDFEELRGWLRSLIRSAPEPDAGMALVTMPSADETRLPIVRRRGDLERRRRPRAAVDDTDPGAARHRHRRSRDHGDRSPRALGRILLLLILLALAAAVAYAALFLPKAGTTDRSQSPAGSASRPTASSQAPAPTGPAQPAPADPAPDTGRAPSTNAVTPSAPDLPAGYVLRDDPEGFRIAVDRTWRRSPVNDIGQVRYGSGDFTLVVVPGRDSADTSGSDPLEYQRNKERELQPWRDSTWATATGLRRVDVGRQSMAEGQFTWQDSNGRQVYVRNLAVLIDGRYHVIMATGPESERDKVTEIHEQATRAYRTTR